MRKSYLCSKIGLLALLAIAVYSCKKPSNGINNNSILETPYGLYVCDSGGTLYNTNDGIKFNKILFPADGFASRALCTSGKNILWVKNHLYFSGNNGINFNHSYDSVTSTTFLAINQSLLLKSDDEKRIYVTESIGSHLGIAYSERDGEPISWVRDTLYDTAIHVPANVSSFTELKNNIIVAYDAVQHRFFYRTSSTSQWEERTNTSGVFNLPPSGVFTLGHFNNLLVAIDNIGTNGAYYSADTGVVWTKFTGLPNRQLHSIASPFDAVLLVGTDSAGVYRFDGTTFVSSNAGLGNYAVVNGIAGKENFYKNGNLQQYIYLATNQGLYQSVDGGHNWILTIKGNFVNIY